MKLITAVILLGINTVIISSRMVDKSFFLSLRCSAGVHSLRIYPYPMVWPLTRPWSQSPSKHRNPRNKGFSGSGAPIFGFGLADPMPKGGRGLSVLKRCVPKTLAFVFGLRLRSKTRRFKTRVLGRRLPNGKPQERLRFRALRSKTLAFKKRIAIASCDLKTSLGARACV